MGTIKRRRGLEGGIDRWVSKEEAQQLAAEINAVDTLSRLEEWAYESPLAPPLPSGAGRAFVGVSLFARYERMRTGDGALEDKDAIVRAAVADLAGKRRLGAVRSWARDQRVNEAQAMQTAARCPTCEATLDVRFESDNIYCNDHRDEQDREIEGLED